ncbi:B-cell receptor CD22-like isoform X2 [Astyanax mexicanus]|nr:B-cell receptor CD22-like isoform X2 [Astyanax mexicanus]XP_049325895.1 B-cell receptor CD22-like isoform X2 [Astyanax mexicanus]
MYCVRITTNEKAERYLGYPGVMLRVTELRVVVPERVSEGNATLLTCATTCNLTEKATFTWFKNGQLLQTNNQNLNTLYIQSTRIDDAARYCCAVKQYEHCCSPEVFLNVRYPPKNVSVSISPSGGIVEGSSVTLTCRGDAYPPVQNYTWFKVKAMVGQGSTFTISKISPEDSGEYKCKCINAEGVRYSAVVTLKVVDGLSKCHQAVIGVLIFSAFLSFAVVLVLLWWKKKFCWSEDQTLKQDNIYSNVSVQTPARNAPQSKTSSHDQDDCQYAIIEHQSAMDSPVEASSSRYDEEAQYSMVQHCGDEPVKNTQEEDIQYACVTFNQSNRPAETVKNDSVIYSTVK